MHFANDQSETFYLVCGRIHKVNRSIQLNEYDYCGHTIFHFYWHEWKYISHQIDVGKKYHHNQYEIFIIIKYLCYFSAILIFMTESLLVCGFIKAAKQLHLGLLRNILKSPMSFFDTTPVGRIVNRFSKDIDAIDNRLIYEFKDTIISLFCFIICIMTVCSATPMSGVVMVLLTLVYFYFQVNYFKLCQIDISTVSDKLL